jgi:hypothetical protein
VAAGPGVHGRQQHHQVADSAEQVDHEHVGHSRQACVARQRRHPPRHVKRLVVATLSPTSKTARRCRRSRAAAGGVSGRDQREGFRLVAARRCTARLCASGCRCPIAGLRRPGRERRPGTGTRRPGAEAVSRVGCLLGRLVEHRHQLAGKAALSQWRLLRRAGATDLLRRRGCRRCEHRGVGDVEPSPVPPQRQRWSRGCAAAPVAQPAPCGRCAQITTANGWVRCTASRSAGIGRSAPRFRTGAARSVSAACSASNALDSAAISTATSPTSSNAASLVDTEGFCRHRSRVPSRERWRRRSCAIFQGP